MRYLGFAVAVAGIFLALGPLNVSQAGDDSLPHYPDLQTLSPSQLKIRKSGGQKLLRLSNTVINLGDGPLELFPVLDTSTEPDTTKAYQRVYSGDGSVDSETPVGNFVFHPTHLHWHLEGFARYQLYTVAVGGGVGSPLSYNSDKVSFCIIDVAQVDSSLTHSSGQTYTSCGANAIQGLSVGWGDTYLWNLAGQSIDITGLGNGDYWLVSTADPDNLLAETNNGNNQAAVKIRIRGNGVKIVP